MPRSISMAYACATRAGDGAAQSPPRISADRQSVSTSSIWVGARWPHLTHHARSVSDPSRHSCSFEGLLLSGMSYASLCSCRPVRRRCRHVERDAHDCGAHEAGRDDSVVAGGQCPHQQRLGDMEGGCLNLIVCAAAGAQDDLRSDSCGVDRVRRLCPPRQLLRTSHNNIVGLVPVRLRKGL